MKIINPAGFEDWNSQKLRFKHSHGQLLPLIILTIISGTFYTNMGHL